MEVSGLQQSRAATIDAIPHSMALQRSMAAILESQYFTEIIGTHIQLANASADVAPFVCTSDKSTESRTVCCHSRWLRFRIDKCNKIHIAEESNTPPFIHQRRLHFFTSLRSLAAAMRTRTFSFRMLGLRLNVSIAGAWRHNSTASAEKSSCGCCAVWG